MIRKVQRISSAICLWLAVHIDGRNWTIKQQDAYLAMLRSMRSEPPAPQPERQAITINSTHGPNHGDIVTFDGKPVVISDGRPAGWNEARALAWCAGNTVSPSDAVDFADAFVHGDWKGIQRDFLEFVAWMDAHK